MLRVAAEVKVMMDAYSWNPTHRAYLDRVVPCLSLIAVVVEVASNTDVSRGEAWPAARKAA